MLQLVVMALVVALSWFALDVGNNSATSVLQKSMSTIQKLNMVETRLTGFMIANQRLPCPADGQYQENTANFGVESANPGSCTGGTPAAPLTYPRFPSAARRWPIRSASLPRRTGWRSATPSPSAASPA